MCHALIIFVYWNVWQDWRKWRILRFHFLIEKVSRKMLWCNVLWIRFYYSFIHKSTVWIDTKIIEDLIMMSHWWIVLLVWCSWDILIEFSLIAAISNFNAFILFILYQEVFNVLTNSLFHYFYWLLLKFIVFVWYPFLHVLSLYFQLCRVQCHIIWFYPVSYLPLFVFICAHRYLTYWF